MDNIEGSRVSFAAFCSMHYANRHRRARCGIFQDLEWIHRIHELAILCLIPWIQEVVYLYMLIIVTCPNLSFCRGKLTFKCHWILSKFMEVATSIYLFLMSGMKFYLELSDYWAFSLVHAACKLQSGCENYSLTFVFIVNKASRTLLLSSPVQLVSVLVRLSVNNV